MNINKVLLVILLLPVGNKIHGVDIEDELGNHLPKNTYPPQQSSDVEKFLQTLAGVTVITGTKTFTEILSGTLANVIAQKILKIGRNEREKQETFNSLEILTALKSSATSEEEVRDIEQEISKLRKKILSQNRV